MDFHDQEPLRNVGDIPAMGAARYGNKRAFEYRGEETTYTGLDRRANAVANVLSDNGVDPGDRVALYLENSLQFPESFFGAIRAGAVPVPLNHRMDVGRLSYILDDAGASVLVGSSVFPSVVGELSESVPTTLMPDGGEGYIDYDEAVASASSGFDPPARAFDDVALQCYTSGTTGDPKGVLTTHENLLTTARSYTKLGSGDPEESVSLVVLPLFHMYGLGAVMLTVLYQGGEIILKTLPVAETLLSAITEHGVTTFAGIPAIFIEMVSEYEENPDVYDLSTIEGLASGAAPLAEDTRRRIERTFNAPLTEGWGMTETSPAGTVKTARGVRKGAGCVGQPVPDLDIKVVDTDTRETLVSADFLDPTGVADPDEVGIDFDDESAVTGELAVRGPQVFAGYHGLSETNEAVFDEEGWFYTGDVARVDEDRFLWMVDRKDDMMVVGGENVYPAEVEDALYDHPDIREVAVVAAPHEIKGEAPVAFVVTEHGVEPGDLAESDVREFALERVPTYSHPRRVFFVDDLPRSGTQKVQRYKLEDDAEERLGAPLEPSETL